jgi:hypothetical protein
MKVTARIKVNGDRLESMVTEAVKQAEQIPEDKRVDYAVRMFAMRLEQCITIEAEIPTP